MILFGNPLNVAVRRTLCSAALRGVELEHVSVLRGSDDPVFRAASPAGIIPALRDGATSLMGALPVINYLDAIGDSDRVIPEDPQLRAQALSVAQVADGPLAQAVSVVFQNKIFIPRFMGKPGNLQLVRRTVRGGLPKILDVAETELTRFQATNERITIAQIAIFSQCLSLCLSGHGIGSQRYPTISNMMGELIRDHRLTGVISRDVGLVGSTMKTLLELVDKDLQFANPVEEIA